jgi:hypothetical protein
MGRVENLHADVGVTRAAAGGQPHGYLFASSSFARVMADMALGQPV